jgi:ABC-type phosphonate transport system ATPase subunit
MAYRPGTASGPGRGGSSSGASRRCSITSGCRTQPWNASIQAQVLNLTRDLQRRLGLTYLFISHDLAVVRYLSDHIGVMYLGKLAEVGPAGEVYL